MKTHYAIVAVGGLLASGCGGSGGPAPAQNAAPMVSAIADRTATANEAIAPIEFSIGDDATPAADLTVTAMTLDEGVVIDGNVKIEGQSSDRILIVTPVADEIGNAVISVVVTDDAGLSDASSFMLTVDPQMKDLSEFTRGNFADSEEGDPVLINAVVFDEDTEDDEFDDLLN